MARGWGKSVCLDCKDTAVGFCPTCTQALYVLKAYHIAGLEPEYRRDDPSSKEKRCD